MRGTMARLCYNVFLFGLFCASVCAVTLPRGLPLSKKSFYREGHPFTCLDGSRQLAWNKVNDDYCDCADGSDEPGTSACPNSFFYCANRDFRAKFLPSSRVDDGICDCCDGSDEYHGGGPAICPNTCWEKGRAAREEAERQQRAYEEGAKIHADYLASVEVLLKEKRQRLEALTTELAGVAAQRKNAEEAKTAAEAPEKVALDEHRKAWEQRKEAARARRDAARMEAAFAELDKNSDGRVDVAEMQRHAELDKDASGEVSAEEARDYLLGDAFNSSDVEEKAPETTSNPSVQLADFRDKVWPRIKDVYKKPKPEPVEDEGAGEDQEGAAEKDKADSDDDKDAEEEKEPEQDEATKQLVAAADTARKAFQTLDDQHRNLENEKQELDKLLVGNYGPGNVFLNLAVKPDCFEFADREYTYKLCPFREVTQVRKDGGGSTSLGHWGEWQQEYSAMLYDKGEGCWNGPARSTRVKLHCAAVNELKSASEPSRCEYLMDFYTPAACGKPPAAAGEGAAEAHDEL